MVLIQVLHRVRTNLSRPSTLVLEEVEVVDVAMVVAEVSLMTHNKIRDMQVAEASSLEAGGVKGAEEETIDNNKILEIAGNVGVVVKKVTCSVTVQKGRQIIRMESASRETMHPLVDRAVEEVSTYVLFM